MEKKYLFCFFFPLELLPFNGTSSVHHTRLARALVGLAEVWEVWKTALLLEVIPDSSFSTYLSQIENCLCNVEGHLPSASLVTSSFALIKITCCVSSPVKTYFVLP